MNHPIYYLVSVIIGTSIILLLVSLNTYTSDSNIEALRDEILMQNFLTTQEIIEFHLKKIGFKTGNNSILEADSTRIKFNCYDNLSGQFVQFEIKTKEETINTANPHDFAIVLFENEKEKIIAPNGVTKFILEYFDVNGNPTTEKIFIKSIKVTLRMESEEKVNGYYLFFESQFIVKPRNLV